MIISKAALQSVHLSKRDASIPQLEMIHIDPDGTVVAASRNTTIAISPPPAEATKNLPVSDTGSCGHVNIFKDDAVELINAIGTDRTFGGRLEYADVSVSNGRLRFEVVDETGRHTTKDAPNPGNGVWINWMDLIRNHGKTIGKFILNRARLHALLDVLDRITPETGGETPLYLEFTEDNYVIIRAKNYVTGQNVFGLILSYAGAELEQSKWETEIRTGSRNQSQHNTTARRTPRNVSSPARRERRIP